MQVEHVVDRVATADVVDDVAADRVDLAGARFDLVGVGAARARQVGVAAARRGDEVAGVGVGGDAETEAGDLAQGEVETARESEGRVVLQVGHAVELLAAGAARREVARVAGVLACVGQGGASVTEPGVGRVAVVVDGLGGGVVRADHRRAVREQLPDLGVATTAVVQHRAALQHHRDLEVLGLALPGHDLGTHREAGLGLRVHAVLGALGRVVVEDAARGSQ